MPDSMTLEVLPRDLSAYRNGNVGVDYVHRFESGRPGPDIVVNALTHGNEFCGMVAVCDLLDRQVRPLRGSLTLSFSNVRAYESFDAARPFDSRQLVDNFNRVWTDSLIDGDRRSPELDRARELRPVFARADHLLDLHSTAQAVDPFWVYLGLERNAQLALGLEVPRIHMVMPAGLGSGVPIIQYGRFADSGSGTTALVAECGQHFLRSTSDVAVRAVQDYLARLGVLAADPVFAGAIGVPGPVGPSGPLGMAGPHRRYELLSTLLVKTPEFRFTGPYIGFESFAEGELIATDGADEIRSPCDHCTILMPTRAPIVGREAVYLTRPMA